MKDLKSKIIDILTEHQTEEHSSTGTTGEFIITSDSFNDIADDMIKLSESKNTTSDFKQAVEPAIRYLFKNHHPHTKIHIDYDRAELLEGKESCNLSDEIPD